MEVDSEAILNNLHPSKAFDRGQRLFFGNFFVYSWIQAVLSHLDLPFVYNTLSHSRSEQGKIKAFHVQIYPSLSAFVHAVCLYTGIFPA